MVKANSVVFKGLLALMLVGVLSSFAVSLVNAKPVLDFHELPIDKNRDFKIVSLDFPSSMQIGSKSEGLAVIRNVGSGGGEASIEIRINNKLHSIADVNLASNQESRYPLRLKFMETGSYTLEIRTPTDSKQMDFVITLGGDDVPPLGQPAAPPPTSGPTDLRILDSNSDCTIDDGEFFDAIDQWISNIVQDGMFFSVVDAWVSQRSICSASSAPNRELISVSLSSSAGAIFTAGDRDIMTMDVQVFDLSGGVIFTGRTNGTRLIWNLNSRAGQPVANGTYFYRVKTQGSQGEVFVGKVEKFAVVR
jgi:hypothetical protein